MRIFIAGPNSRMDEFPAARQRLEALGYTTVTGHITVIGDYPDAWSAFLRDDLAGCDGLAALDGSMKAPGACYEIGVAHGLGVPVMGIEWWATRPPAEAAQRLAEMHELCDPEG